MRFTSFLENGRLTVVLTGEIDHHCAKHYIKAIAAKIDSYTPEECILDFSEVSFMDSSGIAVVINSYPLLVYIVATLFCLDKFVCGLQWRVTLVEHIVFDVRSHTHTKHYCSVVSSV